MPSRFFSKFLTSFYKNGFLTIFQMKRFTIRLTSFSIFMLSLCVFNLGKQSVLNTNGGLKLTVLLIGHKINFFLVSSGVDFYNSKS